MIDSKKIKYIGINLMKEVNDLYSEYFETLKKGIAKYNRKWKDHPCSWVGRIITVVMAILPKSYLQIKCNSSQNLYLFFIEVVGECYPINHLEQ